MRSGIAQSFFESVNASVPTSPDALHNVGSPTSPGTCDCCCRCGRSPKWQPVGPGRKRRSKSYTALRTGISELSGWDLEPTRRQEPVEIDVAKSYGPGEAPIERLPVEVLGMSSENSSPRGRTDHGVDEIIAQLAVDIPPAGYGPRNVDLVACLLTSKTIHVATINTLYSQITLPHSSVFAKFLHHVSEHPGLGTIVRRLDLSHTTSVGLGRSRQSNTELQNLTSKTLLRCLELIPAVQEVLLQENLDDDIDEGVLRKLFFGLPKLRAIDFCASASSAFVDAFTSTLTTMSESPSKMLNIRRLGLHECFTLPSSAFETLLPYLPQLTHLDVSHTRITNEALMSLPESANLSHLNLGRCICVTGEGVVDFLTTHPAVRSLVYLNLSCDISRYRLISDSDLDRLLPALPSTLRSLSLNGAEIHPRHIPQLVPLTKHVEELGLACANLSLADVNTLFRQPGPSPTGSNNQQQQPTWIRPALHYLDLTAIPAITQSTLFNTPAPTNILLTPTTLPLEVIELGDKAISSLRECKNTNKRLGWVVKELGRRGWYVREPVPGTGGNGPGATTGRRGWKMGAMWWGMRKVPVAWGEVGGVYGHYMFKK